MYSICAYAQEVGVTGGNSIERELIPSGNESRENRNDLVVLRIGRIGTSPIYLPPGDIPGVGGTPPIVYNQFSDVIRTNNTLLRTQTNLILELQESIKKLEQRVSSLEKELKK